MLESQLDLPMCGQGPGCTLRRSLDIDRAALHLSWRCIQLGSVGKDPAMPCCIRVRTSTCWVNAPAVLLVSGILKLHLQP